MGFRAANSGFLLILLGLMMAGVGSNNLLHDHHSGDGKLLWQSLEVIQTIGGVSFFVRGCMMLVTNFLARKSA